MTAPVQLDRLPPHDTTAEECVLGVCLKDPAQAPRLLELVKPHDFFHERNGAVLAAISAIYERDGVTAINRRRVTSELARMGRDTEVGADYMAELVAALPMTQGAEFWARSVAQSAFYRRSISVLSALTTQAYGQPDDVDTFLDSAVDGILNLAPEGQRGALETFRELMDSSLGQWLMEHMEDPARISGIPTGFPTLDGLIDGLQRGSLYILAAETSAGKSLFAHNLILTLARAGSRFLVISSEMTNRSVGKRIVFIEAEVDAQTLRRKGRYDDDSRYRVNKAMNSVRALPVAFWNPGTLTFANIRSAVRKLRARGGIDVLIIDHIDHVGGGGDRRTSELELLMRQVKGLAESEGIAILAISHMSRGTQGASKLSRLKNSSSKEQDADVVMFLQPGHWEAGEWVDFTVEQAQTARSAQSWVEVRLEVFKNREGLTGSVDLVMAWDQGGRFYEAVRPR